jgi:hypothetical protein
MVRRLTLDDLKVQHVDFHARPKKVPKRRFPFRERRASVKSIVEEGLNLVGVGGRGRHGKMAPVIKNVRET